MPSKSGKLSPQERAFAGVYAETGDRVYSATKAGYGSPAVRASEVLARPGVVEFIHEKQIARIRNEVLPLAVGRHVALLQDKNVTGQVLNRAIEMAYKYGLGGDAGAAQKEPHEMTPHELARAIEVLERAASDQAKPVEVVETAGVFA